MLKQIREVLFVEDFHVFLNTLRHPILAAVDPWILGIAILCFVAAIGMAVWSYFEYGEIEGWGKMLSFCAAGLFLLGVWATCDPALDDMARLQDAALLATIICACLAFAEEYFWQWRIKPFMYLTFALLIAQAVPIALSVPSYLKLGLSQAASALASVPTTYVVALGVVAALVTLVNQLLELFGNVGRKNRL